jgi:hypothetical protein
MRLFLTTAAVAALALPPPAARAQNAVEAADVRLRQAVAQQEAAKARLEQTKATLKEAEAQRAAAERALAVAQKAVEDEAQARAAALQQALIEKQQRLAEATRSAPAKPKGGKKGGEDKLDQVLRRLDAIEKRLDALEKKGRGAGEELPPLQVTPADQYREDAKPSTGRVR